MSKKPQPEDLILMLDWTDSVMLEVRKFLKDQQPASAGSRNPNDSQVSMPEELNSTKALNPLAMIATKAADASREVENLDRDTKIIERLEKLEKQIRRSALIGFLLIGLTTVISLVFALHLGQVYLGAQISLLPGAQGISSHKPQNPADGPGSAPKTSVAATDSQKSIPQQPEAASSPPSPGAEAAPQFMGSKTSNKYHYPDCKWAKRISPQNLTTFPSVKEAREKGYLPCPGCKPPLSD